MGSRHVLAWCGAVLMVASCSGCAHDRGNTYAYAPPYAPAVYPQPPAVAQPVSYAAPVMPAPVAGAPGPAVSGAAVGGQATPCPQACPDGTVVGAPVVVEGVGQTPPCPPGP